MQQNLSEKIQSFKDSIQKFPVRNSKEFEDFAGFIYAYDEFSKPGQQGKNDASVEKQHFKKQYLYHLEKLWTHILMEFSELYWFCDDHGFNDELCKKYLNGGLNIQNVKTKIKTAIENNELKSFFAAFLLADGKASKEFDNSVKIVFRNEDNKQKLWKDINEKVQKTKLWSKKRYQTIQLKYLIDNIKSLKETMNKIFTNQYIDITSDPVASIACEMLYGFCLDGFKNINKFINALYDYDDKALYFVCLQHPLEKTKGFLSNAIKMRNEMFHFERFFTGGGMRISFARELWFDWIQQLTRSMFFPEALVISAFNVSKENRFSDSIIKELEDFIIALSCDMKVDTLNMQKIYEQQTNTFSEYIKQISNK